MHDLLQEVICNGVQVLYLTRFSLYFMESIYKHLRYIIIQISTVLTLDSGAHLDVLLYIIIFSEIHLDFCVSLDFKCLFRCFDFPLFLFTG